MLNFMLPSSKKHTDNYLRSRTRVYKADAIFASKKNRRRLNREKKYESCEGVSGVRLRSRQLILQTKSKGY